MIPLFGVLVLGAIGMVLAFAAAPPALALSYGVALLYMLRPSSTVVARIGIQIVAGVMLYGALIGVGVLLLFAGGGLEASAGRGIYIYGLSVSDAMDTIGPPGMLLGLLSVVLGEVVLFALWFSRRAQRARTTQG